VVVVVVVISRLKVKQSEIVMAVHLHSFAVLDWWNGQRHVALEWMKHAMKCQTIHERGATVLVSRLKPTTHDMQECPCSTDWFQQNCLGG